MNRLTCAISAAGVIGFCGIANANYPQLLSATEENKFYLGFGSKYLATDTFKVNAQEGEKVGSVANAIKHTVTEEKDFINVPEAVTEPEAVAYAYEVDNATTKTEAEAYSYDLNLGGEYGLKDREIGYSLLTGYKVNSFINVEAGFNQLGDVKYAYKIDTKGRYNGGTDSVAGYDFTKDTNNGGKNKGIVVNGDPVKPIEGEASISEEKEYDYRVTIENDSLISVGTVFKVPVSDFFAVFGLAGVHHYKGKAVTNDIAKVITDDSAVDTYNVGDTTANTSTTDDDKTTETGTVTIDEEKLPVANKLSALGLYYGGGVEFSYKDIALRISYTDYQFDNSKDNHFALHGGGYASADLLFYF